MFTGFAIMSIVTWQNVQKHASHTKPVSLVIFSTRDLDVVIRFVVTQHDRCYKCSKIKKPKLNYPPVLTEDLLFISLKEKISPRT